MVEVFRIVHETTRDPVSNPVDKVMHSGRIEALANHTLLIAKDGSETPIADSGAPIRNAAGEITGVVLVFRDQTRERAARTSLEQSQSRLLRAQSVAHIGDWAFDYKTLTVSASEEARLIYGLPPGANWTMDVAREVPLPEYRAMLDDAMRNLRDKGEPYDVEFRIRRFADGALRDVHSVAEYDAEQQRAFGVIQDITNQKEAERALVESERYYRLLTENTIDCIWVLDLDMCFTFVSRAAEDLFGYTPDELVHTPMSDYCDEENMNLIQHHFLEGLSKGPGHQGAIFECRLLNKMRQPVPVEVHGTIVYDAEGVPVSVQGVTRDIRERKKLEESLMRSQRLQSVGQLAGGVAHDFNNLLMGIMNYVDLCRDEVPSDHPVRGYLDEILHEANRSAAITRQLLAFARKQVVSPKVLDLNVCVGDMLNMLRRLIGEDIQLRWEPGAVVWPVKLDPAQLDQLLANLAVNARDAIQGVGVITVRTGNVHINAAYCESNPDASPGDYVVLSVLDSGCGMDADTRNKIFEPFFTTKEVGQGTGLGLATVYGIVRQNGGFIQVSSQLGVGSTFRIFLRREQDEHKDTATTLPVRADADGVGGTETILLVEDEKSVRVTVTLFLERAGYKVLAASSPAEALQYAVSYGQPFDLLLTDVVMPGMNGSDLVARLRADGTITKVVFMSGYSPDAASLPHTLTTAHFLPKPILRDTLLKMVREVLDQPV